ncbi:MAG: hypothetical protein HY027_12540 [Deltaproteobacteria bacterium]|nr:hypothetical protein [Deltaproteobacteria bacterium]
MLGGYRKTLLIVVALCLHGRVAESAVIIVDEFTSAVNTIETTTTVGVFVAGGMTTASDTGLSDVLGHSRELTVFAVNTPGFIPGLDNVISGVVPLAGFLDYNSTAGADGKIILRYDRGGLGLHADFDDAAGLRLATLDADKAAVPYQVTFTLTDTDGNTGALTKTVAPPDITPELIFPFAAFPGVNQHRIKIIQVDIDPNSDGAADLRLERIVSYPKGRNSAPLLAPSIIAVMAVALFWFGRRRLARS